MSCSTSTLRAHPTSCAMRARLNELEPEQFDAVYCSHNLEHYYWHDVPRVLDGFIHILKPDGFAHIRVPDIGALIRMIAEKNMDLEDVAYRLDNGVRSSRRSTSSTAGASKFSRAGRTTISTRRDSPRRR